MGSFKAILTFGFLMVLAVGCGGGEEAATTEAAPEPAEEMTMEYPTASATLAARAGGTETGSLTFTQTADGVTVWASIEGAPPGAHGLHIHDVGDCSADDFTSAGGHFNPTGAPHGGPGDAERHAGDLGNIEIGEDGTGSLELSSDMLNTWAMDAAPAGTGGHSVVGRGVILHGGADDLVSQPTGAAGARLACGVVEAGS